MYLIVLIYQLAFLEFELTSSLWLIFSISKFVIIHFSFLQFLIFSIAQVIAAFAQLSNFEVYHLEFLLLNQENV